jgi:hypothetical protein
VCGLFILENISFVVRNFLILRSPICPTFSCWAAGVLLRKSLPIPITSRVFLAFSCINLRVSDMVLRSLIHFELTLVQDDKHGSNFSFLWMDNHFSQQYLLKRLSFLHCMFLAPLSKISLILC